MSSPVRVLVVDDSALMRKLIPQILERDGSIRVVGTAMDGSFVSKKIEELRPDVITLDLEMPRMDGMDTLREIMRTHRLPVIVVSAHSTQGASTTFKALSMGAFDFVAKPRDAASSHMDQIGDELIRDIVGIARHPGRMAHHVQHPAALQAGANAVILEMHRHLDLDPLAGELPCAFADVDLTAAGDAAESRGDVHRVADDRVLEAAARADVSGDYVAAVDAEPEL